jgi:hypothetical protein
MPFLVGMLYESKASLLFIISFPADGFCVGLAGFRIVGLFVDLRVVGRCVGLFGTLEKD